MEWTDRQDPTSFIFESIESSTMLGTEPIPKTLLAIPYKTPSADTRALETNSSSQPHTSHKLEEPWGAFEPGLLIFCFAFISFVLV